MTHNQLIDAIAQNDQQTVKNLLPPYDNANVNKKGSHDWTPLHDAACFNRHQIVEILIDAGADLEAVNIYGRTPLHCAAMNGCIIASKLLIKADANINAKDFDGFTPLHYSAKHNHIEIAEELLKAGADVSIVNGNGETSADVSRTKEIKALIESYYSEDIKEPDHN